MKRPRSRFRVVSEGLGLLSPILSAFLLLVPMTGRAQQPSTFVHGLAADAAFWGPTADWMSQQVWITPYRWSLGWWNTYQSQASNLNSYLGSLNDVIGTGHSNGGIVLRQQVQQYGSNSQLNRLMTIGSPHHGAKLADNVINGQLSAWANWVIGSILSTFEWYFSYDVYFDPSSQIVSYQQLLTYEISWIPGVLYNYGWVANVDVMPQMSPAGSYFASLNAPSGLNVEAANTVARVGIGSSINPTMGVFRNFYSNVGWLNVLRWNLHDFAWNQWYYYTYEQPDWWLASNAWRWEMMANALYWFDVDWANLVGAFDGNYVYPYDGVVPLSSQQFPGGTLQQDFAYPSYDISHLEQDLTPAIRTFMASTYRNTFGVPNPPAPPPDPLNVSIQGPYEIPTWGAEGCDWLANVSGGSGPYQYEWYWDNQLVSTDIYYVPGGASQGSHWLHITVTDPTGSDWDGREILVDDSYSCW